MMRRIVPVGLLLLVAALCGCPAPAPSAGTDTVEGKVSFPGFRVQTTLVEVAQAATVSLIDATANQTIGTTLTDSRGIFVLRFPRNTIDPNKLYYLEAVKGLGPNAFGQDAVRVRTLATQRKGGWISLTNALPGSVTLNTSTTALSLITSLRGLSDPTTLNGLVGTIQIDSGDGSRPDSYADASGVTHEEFETVWGLAAEALARNMDPFDAVIYSNGVYSLKQALGWTSAPGPSIVSALPTMLSEGETLTLTGRGFSAVPSGNTVTFQPAVPATVSAAASTSLQVVVPAGAKTGVLTLLVGTESATVSVTIIPSVAGGVSS